MGTFVSSVLRDALGAECIVLNAGYLRGDKDYPKETHVSMYREILTERLMEARLLTLPLPGWVIDSAVTTSRAPALETPPVSKGGFLQLDDGIVWDGQTNHIVEICNKPFKSERLYTTVVIHKVAFEGIDNIKPLFEYVQSTFPTKMGGVASSDRARPLKEVFLRHFS